MTKRILRFRAIDRGIFETIKDGRKTVETRAGTAKYRALKAGNVIVLICGRERMEREIKKVWHFNSMEELVKNISLAKIMPGARNIDEAASIWCNFPGYKEKITKFGLVAWEI